MFEKYNVRKWFFYEKELSESEDERYLFNLLDIISRCWAALIVIMTLINIYLNTKMMMRY